MHVSDCIFCKVVSGEIPASVVASDDECVAFEDISPQAPVHILIVPREHIDSMDKATGSHGPLIGNLMLKAAEIARQRGFADDGYRIVVNTNGDGGQTVFHIHVHLLAGRPFVFPPG